MNVKLHVCMKLFLACTASLRVIELIIERWIIYYDESIGEGEERCDCGMHDMPSLS